MKKELVVGKNYYSVFGSDTTGTKKMIYNGGISWTAIDGDRQMTMDSQATTDNVLKCINSPRYSVGTMR